MSCSVIGVSGRPGFGALDASEPLGNQGINKCFNIIMYVTGWIESIPAQGRDHAISSMLSVKELPDVETGGAQAKTTTGFCVEENGPVVKLFPQNDKRVRYQFLIAMEHEMPICNIRTEAPWP
jgi:hypothetical protein